MFRRTNLMEMSSDNNCEKIARWLRAFEEGVAVGDKSKLKELFVKDCHWRDLLAFTWHITTLSKLEKVVTGLIVGCDENGAKDFQLTSTARKVSRGGQKNIIEGIFKFRTNAGECRGVLRLCSESGDSGELKAWTIMTALDHLRAVPDKAGNGCPKGDNFARDFSGPNWLDMRKFSVAYEDREPEVLVVGGGQAGLSIAARLTQLGVDTLVLDRERRIGDNWRQRYHALVLHNQVHVNHLPYLDFPENWPTYIPKDKLASWFEFYVEAMELNFWTGAEFLGAEYSEKDRRWYARAKTKEGNIRSIKPRHIVMATGVSGIPNIPEVPTLPKFKGKVVHSSEFKSARDNKEERVLILGTGTSAHDIAQDLVSNGSEATMVQRRPTSVLNVEPSAQLPYTLYKEGHELCDADLLAAATPYQPLRCAHELLAVEASSMDQKLLVNLEAAGFEIDRKDKYGWQFKYMTRGGGYYFNVGCSDLIVSGDVGILQLSDIETFLTSGIKLKNGKTLSFDTVVLATGFKGQEEMVNLLFGGEVEQRVGPIWGFDEKSQELRNMWVRTGQPGLWFIAGSFAQCRIYSKYLGLQIKACIEGVIPNVRNELGTN